MRGPAGRTRTLVFAAAALLGVCTGLGAFTMHYAEGTAYLSNNPEACANCHIMWDQFDSWNASSHSAVAACVDCHLPHAIVPKWLSKAENGWNHSLAFTLQNYPDPIVIKPRNRDIVQRNCVSCHDEMVHELLPATVTGASVSCIHCHSRVGHAAAR